MPDLTARMPSSLRERARWERLGPDGVPALLVAPDWEAAEPVPVVLWMHGRTVAKEIDPGRYLRWMRAGIGACAVDLPGHGERLDASLQAPERTLDVVTRMAGEIDGVVGALREAGPFDLDRIAIGGMSAGGMAAITRLTRPHGFACVSLEATTGSWRHQADRPMFRELPDGALDEHDPMRRLDEWRAIPVQAIHAKLDEWVDIEGQMAFLDALRARYADPSIVELVAFDETGAPYEHAGFGSRAAEAKDLQRDFLRRWLEPGEG